MKIPKTKYPGTEMDLATLKHAPDVGIKDHGWCTMFATFDYGGRCQGVGYGIDDKFIINFINVFGAETLSQCKGELFVEHDNGKIYRLIPLPTKGGKEFDIQKWCKECEKNEK